MNSGINSRTEKLFQFFWTAFFILITVIAMIPILRVISVSSAPRMRLRQAGFLYSR